MSVASTEPATQPAPAPSAALAAARGETAAERGRPVLRLLPAPPCEPPYDDEPGARPLHVVATPVRPAPAPTAGATALASAPGAEAVVLRLVPAGSGRAAHDDDDEAGPRTPLVQLPASRPFALALVQRLLEVMAGLRPVSQLQRDTSFELFTDLEGTLVRRPRTAGPRPSRRDVRSVHVQEHEHGVAEVCATVRTGGRVRALALRLEGVDGAWRCTALLGV